MPAFINRLLVGLGLIGSIAMMTALMAHMSEPVYEPVQLFSFWLTFGATVIAILANCFALASFDATGITHEGRVTSMIPIVLAACGVALTVRWGPQRTPFALSWMVLQLPALVVGFRTTTTTLQQAIRRAQAVEDRAIAVQWELKQLTNRVHLLEQLTRPGGPDPAAQKKLASTGNSLEKYYGDTKSQLEKFISAVEDDQHRAAASNMLSTLQQMPIAQRGS